MQARRTEEHTHPWAMGQPRALLDLASFLDPLLATHALLLSTPGKIHPQKCQPCKLPL